MPVPIPVPRVTYSTLSQPRAAPNKVSARPAALASLSSRTGKPNTSGFIVQADWTPFGKEDSPHSPLLNLRLGLQYTGYFKFNGASNNYDGFGRDASDNNAVYGFMSVAF